MSNAKTFSSRHRIVDIITGVAILFLTVRDSSGFQQQPVVSVSSFLHNNRGRRHDAARLWLQPRSPSPRRDSLTVGPGSSVASWFPSLSQKLDHPRHNKVTSRLFGGSNSNNGGANHGSNTDADGVVSVVPTPINKNTVDRPNPASCFSSWLQRLYRCTLKRFVMSRSVWRRRLATAALALTLTFLTAFPALAAVSGGRMGGGSFNGRSSRSSGSSSMSRPAPRMRTSTIPRSRPRNGFGGFGSGPIIINSFPNTGWPSYGNPNPAIVNKRGFSPSDIVVLTGAGALLVYGVRNNLKEGGGGGWGNAELSPLGKGTTVATLTVSLSVADRRDPNNILSRLTRLSQISDTSSQRGLQNLVSEVAVELLRQERSVLSATSKWKNFPVTGQAEREFQSLSVQARSKVDRLTVNKFGNDNRSEGRLNSNGSNDMAPTTAIVTINLAIQGDSTKLPKITTRQDLKEALQKISTDAQVADCLITAEILWTPEDPTETLPQEVVYADFPELIPI